MNGDLKQFFKYIGPSMAGMVIVGTYSIVDTIFIGRAMGKLGLAAGRGSRNAHSGRSET